MIPSDNSQGEFIMKTFARITAIALIAIGLLIMLGGLAAGAAGAFSGGWHHFPGPDGRMPFGHMQGGRIGMGLLFGAALLVQGLIVTAIGQGLYLLNNLGEKPAAVPAPAPRKVAKK
jgi:heme A synthase